MLPFLSVASVISEERSEVFVRINALRFVPCIKRSVPRNKNLLLKLYVFVGNPRPKMRVLISGTMVATVLYCEAITLNVKPSMMKCYACHFFSILVTFREHQDVYVRLGC